MNERTSQDSNSVIDVVRRAVSTWPRTDAEKDLRSNARFSALVSNDFDVGDLNNQITSVSLVLSAHNNETDANVVFQDVDGYVYRASLISEATSGWRLQSLKFQCPVCFGEGENDGRQCTMCDGSGWGVGP